MPVFGRERARRGFRVQAGAEQGLADIDVAEPGDQALVEEGGLQGRALALEEPGDGLARQFVAERLDAHAGEMLRGLDPRARHQIHEAEAAGVVIGDGRAGRELEHHMVVGAGAAVLVMELARHALRAARVTRKRPDMPRCMTSTSPEERSASRYLARRLEGLTPALRGARRTAPGRGSADRAGAASTRVKRAPTMAGSRPRRTVSTSGSSGINHLSGSRAPYIAIRARFRYGSPFKGWSIGSIPDSGKSHSWADALGDGSSGGRS